jgi:restriction system protein
MAIPDYQSLMRPLLEALPRDGSEVTMKAVAPVVAGRLALTEDDLAEMLPSGRQTLFMNRLHWAKTYLDKAGVVTSAKRGVFGITTRGLALLDASPEPISKERLFQFPEYTEWWKSLRGSAPEASKAPEADSSTATPDDQINDGVLAIEGELKAVLLQRFQTSSPAFFERTVVALLQAMGFTNGERGQAFTTGKSGDGGIDGIIHQDALGLDAIYVQAKRYAAGNGVGRPDIQKFVGSMTGESASKGVFVTTSHFSKEATDFVHKVQQRIVLIDGERLAALALSHNIGVRVKSVIELKSLDEDFFADDVLAGDI